MSRCFSKREGFRDPRDVCKDCRGLWGPGYRSHRVLFEKLPYELRSSVGNLRALGGI